MEDFENVQDVDELVPQDDEFWPLEPFEPPEPEYELTEEIPRSEDDLEAMAYEQQRQNGIATAKQILNQTDYQVIKAAEKLLSATTASGLLATIKELAEEFGDSVRLRQECRDQINELEVE